MEKLTFPFCALISRMKYIMRWGLMRQNRNENLSEHTTETAIFAHILALLSREELKMNNINPEAVSVAALYHDATEILTGDLPTPVKYKNPEFKNAYKKIEKESSATLSNLLPQKLQTDILNYMNGDALNSEEKKILKAADILSALVKCIEEENSGNHEFSSAKKQQLLLLKNLDCPACELFIKYFLSDYENNLDELIN